MWYTLYWNEEVFSEHWCNEAFVLHLSTGEEQIVLGGLQQLYLRELFKSFSTYSVKTDFMMGQLRVYS